MEQKMRNMVVVELSQIILGSRLQHPICDDKGATVFAAGLEFTAERREQLRSRRLPLVMIDESDLDKVAGSKVVLPMMGSAQSDEQLQNLETQMNERIDQLIRSGGFNLPRFADPVKSSVARQTARDYSNFHRNAMQNQHAAAARAVDDVAASVLSGNADVSPIEEGTTTFVRSLIADVGCCLATVAAKRKFPSISEHSVNVSVTAMSIGIDMGFDETTLRLLGIAGLLEDLGMMFVPEEMRNAPRKLDKVEFLEIQRHTIYTVNLLQGISGLSAQVPLITYQAHESPDGSGYPRGRTGPSIHPLSRILHVADVYNALTSHRPFRLPLKPYSAMECLIRMAHEGKVDRDVVKHLLIVQSLFPIGSYVVLSDGSIAKVIRSNGADYTRPIVSLAQDHHSRVMRNSSGGDIIDLANSSLTIGESIPAPGEAVQDLTPEVIGWSNRNIKSLANELVA
jgi:HD-GYP domain-containing protein (c-di-GMP phosphodiesterase class II)